eukprot:COSAG01_NODE_6811_length_3487_cov_1.657910_2_plen_126_part_00
MQPSHEMRVQQVATCATAASSCQQLHNQKHCYPPAWLKRLPVSAFFILTCYAYPVNVHTLCFVAHPLSTAAHCQVQCILHPTFGLQLELRSSCPPAGAFWVFGTTVSAIEYAIEHAHKVKPTTKL